MIKVTREDKFIVAVYDEEWDATDFGVCCAETIKLLDQADQPVYYIVQTKTNPTNLNVIKAVTVYRKEIERIYNHPNKLRPTAFILTSFMVPLVRAAFRLPWQRNYSYTFAGSVEEAKTLLLKIESEQHDNGNKRG